jgi:hypothetical protein
MPPTAAACLRHKALDLAELGGGTMPERNCAACLDINGGYALNPSVGIQVLLSALGQKRQFGGVPAASGLPPTTDITLHRSN